MKYNKLFDHFLFNSDVLAAKYLNDKYSLDKEEFLRKKYPLLFTSYTDTKDIQDKIAIESDKKNAFDILGNFERLLGFQRIKYLVSTIEKMPSGSKILDYGCSVGEITVLLASKFPNINFEGADISPVKLKIAQEFITEKGIKNIKYFECNNPDKLKKQEYDAIICTETMEHILEYQPFLENLEKASKIGGKLFFTTPLGPLEVFSFEEDNVREHLHHYEILDIAEMIGHKKDANIVYIPTATVKSVPIGNLFWSWTKNDNEFIGAINYDRKIASYKYYTLI